MEHHKEYKEKRYRVVEQIDKVKEGFRYSIVAYDDETAAELPWGPHHVIRFSLDGMTPTLEDARKNLTASVMLMKTRIADDMP